MCAVKVCNFEERSNNTKLRIKEEANFMTKLKHNNIVYCKASFIDDKRAFTVMELCDFDLKDILREVRKYRHHLIRPDVVLHIFSQVVAGLAYAH